MSQLRPESDDEVTLGGTLRTREPSSIPEVLDVLIVGAGPTGTAAAFRAKELGLETLVIDRDTILGILKDWISPSGDPERDKTVDSSFGPGGRRVPFPAGDELVASLVFGDQVPASSLYNRWMQTYQEHSIHAKSGLDLTELQRRDDRLLVATCMNQRTGEKSRYVTRNIVLAMGRGVPHQLGIPGNTAGINYKLGDPSRFTEGPVCVVGGGTSAAEAVIEISEAKIANGDQTDVIWSYRKRSLPRVNSTLAERFFKAYMGNGNIRYLRHSGPLAVLQHEGGEEYVALRYERRESPAGGPPAGNYLEFSKDRVIACIGADLPIGLLNSLGIQQLKSADTEDDFMAVSPLFESQVANVFLVGDLLSPAYIQTKTFSSEAIPSAPISHVGNFKQGMNDGVLVIEAIRQRLEGVADDETATFLDEKRAEYKLRHKERLDEAQAKTEQEREDVEIEPPPEERTSRVGAKFVHIVRVGDHKNEEDIFLNPGRTVVGRQVGDLCFANDESLVDNHVAIEVDTDACYVSDDGTHGEAFLKVNVERTVQAGDLFRVGRNLLRIQSSDLGNMLAVLDPMNPGGDPTHFLPIAEGTNIYGRQHIVPDLQDEGRRLLSRRHVTIEARGNVFTLRDFGSVNGTFVHVSGAVPMYVGDELYVGEQRFRYDGMETGVIAGAPEPSPPIPEAEALAATVMTAKEPSVTIVNAEIASTFSVTSEKYLLDYLEEQQLATDNRKKLGGRVQSLWDCRKGMCGLCIVKIAQGHESLSEARGKEKNTIRVMVEDLNDQGRELSVADCRLACSCKVEGPVTVELLGNTDSGD